MKPVIIIVLLITACQYGWAHDSFGPWDADVAVGDELLASPDGSSPPEVAARRGGHAGAATDGIYDSFRSGANLMIRVFQLWISPLDGPNCRFRPTCSAYGIIAVRRYGALLGGFLAGDRILRCNPFTKPGDDPVPDAIFNR